MSFKLKRVDLHNSVAQWYSDYLASDKWKRKRIHIIELRTNLCERCRESDAHILHHKTYARLFSELDQDIELLCKHCHAVAHEVDDIPFLYFIYWPSLQDVQNELHHTSDSPIILKPVRRSNPSKKQTKKENNKQNGV